MDTKTVLVVDDDLNIRILLKDFLENEGFKVIVALDGREALDTFQSMSSSIDLVLLDVMLPQYDGWTVCREIRKQSDVLVIMLTARGQDFDEVHGFDVGADDYVTKPVKPTILLARINSLFRRIEKTTIAHKDLYCGGLHIDDAAHVVTLKGEVLILSPKEYTLLLILVDNAGKVISREQFLDLVWGYDYFGGLRTVDTHINKVRIKLGDMGDTIRTIRGFGYKFEV